MRFAPTRALRGAVSSHLSKATRSWRSERAAPGRLPGSKGGVAPSVLVGQMMAPASAAALGRGGVAGMLAAGRAVGAGASRTESRAMSGGGWQDSGDVDQPQSYPPSEKQIGYLQKLSKEMGKEMPDSAYEDKMK